MALIREGERTASNYRFGMGVDWGNLRVCEMQRALHPQSSRLVPLRHKMVHIRLYPAEHKTQD